MENNKRNILFSIGLILIGIIAIIFLYPNSHPLYGVKSSISNDSLKTLSGKVAEFIGVETDDYYLTTKFNTDKDLLRQIQVQYGIGESNRLAREKLSIYKWRLNYYREDNINLAIGSEEPEEAQNMLKGDFEISFDVKGNLVGLELGISDSLKLPNIREDKAERLSSEFVRKFAGFSETTPERRDIADSSSKKSLQMSFSSDKGVETRVTEENDKTGIRRDYEFSFTKKDSVTGNKVVAEVSITGNIISEFNVSQTVPKKFDADNETGINYIFVLIVYLLVLVIMLVLLIKRLRAYEIGFKMGLTIAVLVAVAVAFEIFLQSSTGIFSLEMLIPMAIAPIFLGIAVIILWSITESITREVWQEKLLSLDMLGRGHFSHSKLGCNLLTGIGLAFGLITVWMILSIIFQQIADISMVPLDNHENFISSRSPSLHLLASNFYTEIFGFIMFGVFAVSYLRAKLQSKTLIVLIGAILWGLSISGSINPWYLGNIYYMIIGAFIIIAFLKYEALTVFIGILLYEILKSAPVFFYMNNPDYILSGIALVILLLLAVAYIIFTMISKDKDIDYDDIRPAFAKHISERQRLQRELEIARDVQMSFLPRRKPEVAKLDIAARCLPANEVGGDYYDFVQIDGNKFGVVIGDVSGKGTQAAFYMTLTKGFLKALSKTLDDPVSILSRMNNLFYENVERGTFISVLYGFFDLRNNKLEFARGGHNPVLHINNKGEIKNYNPKGMALGLEKGDIFSQNISKNVVDFKPGDIFVFYTDGFPEAMNKSKEEFGESNFRNIFKETYNLPAEEILETTYARVLKYMVKAKQNDDMTLVIIKIKEDGK